MNAVIEAISHNLLHDFASGTKFQCEIRRQKSVKSQFILDDNWSQFILDDNW